MYLKTSYGWAKGIKIASLDTQNTMRPLYSVIKEYNYMSLQIVASNLLTDISSARVYPIIQSRSVVS